MEVKRKKKIDIKGLTPIEEVDHIHEDDTIIVEMTPYEYEFFRELQEWAEELKKRGDVMGIKKDLNDEPVIRADYIDINRNVTIMAISKNQLTELINWPKPGVTIEVINPGYVRIRYMHRGNPNKS